MDWQRRSGLCGIASTVVFTIGWIAGGLVQPGSYNWSSQEMSDLGALTAHHAWVWNLADLLSGALLLLFAIGLWSLMSSDRAGRAGAALLGLLGFTGILDGLVREDCPVSTSQACQHLRDGPGLSWHHQAHDVESAIAALCVVVAPFLLARAFRRLPQWRGQYAGTLATGIAMVAASFGYAALYGGDGGGIIQRGMWMVAFAWITVLAVRAIALAGTRRAPAPDDAMELAGLEPATS